MTSKKSRSSVATSAAPAESVDPAHVYEQAWRKVQLAHHWRAGDGRSAWSELKRAAYGDQKGRDPRKLSLDDRTILAQRMHGYLAEVAPLLTVRGISRGELCRRAGFCGRHPDDKSPDDAKELYRLTLPLDADARERGIRSSALKYLRLIEVLAETLDISVERLAERLLRRTSVHPLSKTDDEWADLEKVQSLLQRIVNELDEEFGLFNLYRRTAELKCSWINEGSTSLCWPLWNVHDSPLYTPPSPEEIEDYRAKRSAAADRSQAYYRRNQYFHRRRTEGEWWLYGFENYALQDDEFFFVPHAPLGHVLMWDLPDRRADCVAYELAVNHQVQDIRSNPHWLALPTDDWDPEKACPIGQTEGKTGNPMFQYHFWLLAYPDPEEKRLVPTLYQPGEEGGAYLLPLNMEGIEMLSDAVWVSPTEHCRVVDRLRDLLEPGDDGLNPIKRNMQRTAKWLADNPILKLQHEREKRSRRLNEVFRAGS